MDRAGLAGRARGPRAESAQTDHLPRGARALGSPGVPRARGDPGRPGDHALRDRGAEAALAAAGPPSRAPLGPGLLRARGRIRPRQPANPRAPRGGRVRDRRAEDLDDAGPGGDPRIPPRPHGSGRKEAGGHQLPAGGHHDAGNHRAADHDIAGHVDFCEVFFETSGSRSRTGSARRTRAGRSPSRCLATSASPPAAPAPPSTASRSWRRWPRRAASRPIRSSGTATRSCAWTWRTCGTPTPATRRWSPAARRSAPTSRC